MKNLFLGELQILFNRFEMEFTIHDGSSYKNLQTYSAEVLKDGKFFTVSVNKPSLISLYCRIISNHVNCGVICHNDFRVEEKNF